MININAPILPNESLGDIRVRDNINNLLKILRKDGVIYHVSYEKNNDKRVSLYSILKNIIIVAVDNNNSKIFRITGRNGYEGKLLNKIKLGDTINDVYKSDESFYYSERDETILSDKYIGVSLDVEEFDYKVYTLKNPRVQAISVFAVESMTLQAQKGNW